METTGRAAVAGLFATIFILIGVSFVVVFPGGNTHVNLDQILTAADDGSQVRSTTEPAYLSSNPGVDAGNYKVIGLDDQEESDENPYGYDPDELEEELIEKGLLPTRTENSVGSYSGAEAIEDAPIGDLAFVEPLDSEFDGRIRTGIYATSFNTVECGFELWADYEPPKRSSRSSRSYRSYSSSFEFDEDDLPEEVLIGKDELSSGRLIVEINELEPDRFESDESCGDWKPWSPLVESLTVANNGDYWIGDLETGVWQAPTGCRWEKVVSFRGGELSDIEASGLGGTFEVDDATYGVRLRECDMPAELTDIEPEPKDEDEA